MHELKNIVNSLYFTLEQIHLSKEIRDVDIQEVLIQCINKKAETLNNLNTLKEYYMADN